MGLKYFFPSIIITQNSFFFSFEENNWNCLNSYRNEVLYIYSIIVTWMNTDMTSDLIKSFFSWLFGWFYPITREKLVLTEPMFSVYRNTVTAYMQVLLMNNVVFVFYWPMHELQSRYRLFFGLKRKDDVGNLFFFFSGSC